MGVLRKGEQWSEAGYKSPKEIALEKMLEKKRQERQRQEELEQQIFEEDFRTWFNKLSEQDKDEILKSFKIMPKVRKNMNQNQIDEMFVKYFKELEWQGVEA